VITVHTDCYPLVLFYFSPEKHQEADWRALFEKTDEIARRALLSGSYYATIAVVDATVSAAERKLIAQLFEATPPELRARVASSYVVGLPGPIRTILVGLRWLAPNLVQTEPASTVEEAIAAAVKVLSGRGVRVEETARASARRWLETCRRTTAS
jgi:hypothetical protein